MRFKLFSWVFLCVTLLSGLSMQSAQASPQEDQKTYNVSISLRDATVKGVADALTKQTGILFSYDADLNSMSLGEVKVSHKNSSLTSILDEVFANKGVKYSVVGVTVVLSRTKSSGKRTITGQVNDASGMPVPGAVVMVVGQSGGTVTDASGRFSMSASDGDVKLAVQCLGYVEKTQLLSASADNIVMTIDEDALSIDETVVVGYGVQKKVNLTGAISTVSSENLENRTAPTLTHMLQGSVPGLNVTTSSGRPGNSASINIRGINSINGGSPLVLVDGAEGDLSRVNPADVESISVIKDASAAAVYGARASFGVILVTTKSGTEADGMATVRVNSRFGWEAPTTSTEFENRGYYSVYLNDLFYRAANGTNYTYYTQSDMQELWARVNDKRENPARPWVMIDQRDGRDTYLYYANTDWYHELFRDRRPNQQHSVSLSGGTAHVKYLLSGSYNREEGIFRRNTDKLDKYSFRSKISFDIKKWLNLTNNTSYYKYRYRYPGPSDVNTAFSLMTVHALASYPAHNPDGTSIGYTSFANNNYVMDGLLTILDNPNYKNEDNKDNLSTTTELTIKPLASLEIRANFTYALNQNRYMNRATNTEYSRYPGEMVQVTNSRSIDSLKEKIETQHYYATNIYATWTKSIAQAHNIKLMAGFNWETKHYKDVGAKGYYLMSQTLNDLNLVGSDADGNPRMETSGGQNEYALEGFFGRLNYDYKGRYLFEASGRYDGTSRFASSHRWGFFPSMSLGWRISEEKFFAPIKNTMNNFKLRYSYGSLGNQLVGYYDYIRKIAIGTGSYTFGSGSKPTIATIGAPVASNLTWEKTLQHDLGVDLAFFGNRLMFTADAYIRDTKDMLTAGVALPAVYGASSPKMNAADLRTKGYEFQLSWRDGFNLFGKPFNYSVTASFSDYITEITKFDNPERTFAKSYYVGMRIGEIWGYHTGGLFRSDAEAADYKIDQTFVNQAIISAAGDERGLHGGDVKFLDLNGDGVVNQGKNTVDDPGDRTIIGNNQPRYNYGINLSVQYFGFDFGIFFQGVGKMDWAPAANNVLFYGPYARPYATLIPKDFHKKIWSEDNPDAYLPRPRGYVGLGSNRELTVPSDRYLQDISYCRLKNLTFGYTLPKFITDKIGMGPVRFSFSGENLAYWSPFKKHTKYIDPEMAKTNSTNRIYPWQKSFMFGIDLTF